jgi:hypothetical protein
VREDLDEWASGDKISLLRDLEARSSGVNSWAVVAAPKLHDLSNSVKSVTEIQRLGLMVESGLIKSSDGLNFVKREILVLLSWEWDVPRRRWNQYALHVLTTT